MSDGPFTLVLMAHADHDPALTCRPALGHKLCEVLMPEDLSEEEREA